MFHLIEYRAEVLITLHDLVEHLGYGVRQFDSPVDYLHYMQSPDYVLPTALIASYKMPLLNGHQLAVEARNMHPNLKVVLTTSLGNYEVGEEVRQSICAILHKPFEFDGLAASLETLHACHKTADAGALSAFAKSCRVRVANACPHLHG